MRYTLAPIPEDGGDPLALAALPLGTTLLSVNAHWTVTEPDGRFRGGIKHLDIDLKEAT